MLLRFFFLACFLIISVNVSAQDTLFIQNEHVRLGVDLSSGGSIFYFSAISQPRNLLNHFDRGRFVQQSYYGDEDGSYWAKQKWRWNPVQGGDYKGHPAKLLDYKTGDLSLYTKSVPKHWATGVDITDATMETWISLSERVARIRFRFSYNGQKTHQARHQEMPAVFVDYDLKNLVLYQNAKPWTNDTLSFSIPGWPNELRKSTENWAAFVNDRDWGIGVYTPGTDELTCYRYAGKPGPQGPGCSYFAPIRTLSIIPGIVVDYEIYLTIGYVSEIRERFYQIRRK